MPSRNPFTEEGRTRWRNFQRRVCGYIAVWMLAGLGVVLGVFWQHTRRNLEPLQRLYFKQYAVGSVRAAVLKNSSSKYTLLVRDVKDPVTGKEVTLGVTDGQAYPVRGADGRVPKGKNGYFFKLRPGLEARYLYWKRSKLRDREMSPWLRVNIYDGTSLLGLFVPSFALGFVVFVAGAGGTVYADRRVNKRYEEGHLVRGTRRQGPKDYEGRQGGPAGLGLPVHVSQERA
jgi:hypothetical protein